MEKNFDINQQGYSIRCKLLINDNDKQTLTTTTGRGQNGRERSRTTKKAVNLFQDLLLSLAASVAAGIQFL